MYKQLGAVALGSVVAVAVHKSKALKMTGENRRVSELPGGSGKWWRLGDNIGFMRLRTVDESLRLLMWLSSQQKKNNTALWMWHTSNLVILWERHAEEAHD